MLFTHMTVCLSNCLSDCLSVGLFVCLPVVCLTLCFSFCLSFSLSASLYMCRACVMLCAKNQPFTIDFNTLLVWFVCGCTLRMLRAFLGWKLGGGCWCGRVGRVCWGFEICANWIYWSLIVPRVSAFGGERPTLLTAANKAFFLNVYESVRCACVCVFLRVSRWRLMSKLLVLEFFVCVCECKCVCLSICTMHAAVFAIMCELQAVRTYVCAIVCVYATVCVYFRVHWGYL